MGQKRKLGTLVYESIRRLMTLRAPSRFPYGVALTVSLPRPIVAAAIARHADCNDVPAGRSGTALRAYTVNR